jgi:hypothetical protein
MMKSKWVEYDRERILFIDVANLQHDFGTLKNELESAIILLKNEPNNSVLTAIDFRRTFLNNDVLLMLMTNSPLSAPYFKKSALIIEPNTTRRVILESLKQFTGHLPKIFDNDERAKEWLVSNAEY